MAGRAKNAGSASGKGVRRAQTAKGGKSERSRRRRSLLGSVRYWFVWTVAALLAIAVLSVILFGIVNPPLTISIWAEKRRLGQVEHEWVPLAKIAPVAARSIVAAEDANFCVHPGFDIRQIRSGIQEGRRRGASTISQQVTKNVFLWQGRNWLRKALETFLTPLVEAMWSKRRILEVYLNVAEMGKGVFGISAAARHHFGVSARELTAQQAARIAAILPNPKERDPNGSSPWLRLRASAIVDGAATIMVDGRSDCFEE